MIVISELTIVFEDCPYIINAINKHIINKEMNIIPNNFLFIIWIMYEVIYLIIGGFITPLWELMIENVVQI